MSGLPSRSRGRALWIFLALVLAAAVTLDLLRSDSALQGLLQDLNPRTPTQGERIRDRAVEILDRRSP